MNKIKTLNWFIIALIIIYSIQYLANIYLAFFPPDFMNFPNEHFSQFILGYYTQFIGLAFSIVTFTALFYLKNGLSITIKKGFFNQNSSGQFKIAGQLFLISGTISIFWHIILLIYSKGETYFLGVLGSDILLLSFGFGLLIISDFITNGNIIQTENELTI